MTVHFKDPNCGHTLQPVLPALIISVYDILIALRKTVGKSCLHVYKIDSSKESNSTHRVTHMLVIRLKNREAVFKKAYKQVFHPLKLMRAHLLPLSKTYNERVCFSLE